MSRLAAALADRYRIERQLGQGGMATVYLAQDVKHDRRVALKVLKPELAAVLGAERFVVEIKTTASLQHPHILPLFDSGTADGFLYYVMPYIEGETLRGKLNRETQTARSDVYSLGAVLYEMLAGQPPHLGGSAQQIIMKIIAEPVQPVTSLRKSVPPNVASALAQALEKLPADRFESATAFAAALTNPAFTHSAVIGATGTTAGARTSAAWLSDVRSKVAAGLVVALGAALAWIVLAPRAVPDATLDRPVYHVVLRDSTDRLWPVVAPDGSVWIAPSPRRRFLVRRPGATAWSEVATTEVGGFFAVSPDGRRAAYARVVPAGTEVRVLSAESDEETLLATFGGRPAAWVTDWSEDGFIYVSAFLPTGMVGALNLRIPATGSARMDTIPLSAREGVSAYGMKTIPGSDVLLYSEIVPGGAIGATAGRVLAFRPRTGDTLFVAEGVVMDWSPTGHVLVGREGGFVEAVPFDPKAFRVTGPSRQVLAGVAGVGPVIRFAGSRAGALAYFSGSVRDNSGRRFELRWRGLDGTSERIPVPDTDHDDAAVSPDGARIAYAREGRIWIFDSRSGRNAPLSDDTLGTDEHDPLWSPDGSRLVFRSKRTGMKEDQGDLYVQPADGSGPAVRAGGTSGIDSPRQWLGDSAILFIAVMPVRGGSGTQRDIYTVVVNRAGSEKALLESAFDESALAVDPSGRWLSYVTNADGTSELYVRRYPSLENPVRLARPGAGRSDVIGHAAWSADGRSVFYESTQDSLVRVALDLSGDRARVVSQSAVLGLRPGHVEITDRHPTSGRLLQWVVAGTDSLPAPPKLILIVNFDQEIRRIMGEGR